MRNAVIFVLAGVLVSAVAHADEGDPVKGKRQFAPCSACHTLTADEPNKVGPNLHGVFGSKSGSRPGFEYSPAMKAKGVVWDEKSLDAYITKPSEFIPGNKMAFIGLPKPDVRANVIAYLKEATK